MKVLLLNPFLKNETFNLKVKNADNLILPLGICHIASSIEKYGFEVKIVDGQVMCSSWNDFLRSARNFSPDIIGIYVSSYVKKEVLALVEGIKKAHPKVIICVGGPHVSAKPGFISEGPIDFGIRGDAEIPFSKLCVALRDKQDFKKISGLAFRDESGILVSNGVFVLGDLNVLPFPKLDFVDDLSIYHPSIVSYKRLPSMTIVSSRGCPFSCAFCASGNRDIHWRAQSAEYMAEELRFLSVKYGMNDVWFFDDTFTVDRKRVEKFCRKIIRDKIDITWGCLTRVDKVDKQLLALMKKACCWLIGYGLESGTQRILDLMRKGFKVEQAAGAVRLTHKAGIQVKAYFMIGYPGERRGDILRTIDFACSLPITYASFYPVNILPGTALDASYSEFGRLEVYDNATISFGKEMFVPKSLSVAEMLALQKKATRRFYFRPGYIFLQLKNMRSMDDLKKNIYGLLSLL